jgi:hypothetical protein
MARRSISTILVTLVVAMMVGLREATGTAPPPPTLSTEEIVWLSPELENDLDGLVVFEDPDPVESGVHRDGQTRPGHGAVGFAGSFLRRIFGRRG